VYGPFQADFTEQYALITCDARQPKGTLCLSTSGTGTGTNGGRNLGSVRLQRSSIYATGDASTCSPATTQGTLTLANGDIITFMGTGTFCRAFQAATFTYTITGGTGHYQHASGTGTINVPPPTSASAGAESWGGTLLTGT
jgi:hypothetical protein